MRGCLLLAIAILVIGIALVGFVFLDGDFSKLPDLITKFNEEGIEGLLRMLQDEPNISCDDRLRQMIATGSDDLGRLIESGVNDGFTGLRWVIESGEDSRLNQLTEAWLNADCDKELLRTIETEIDAGLDNLFEAIENLLDSNR